jgi:Type IIA topoisomerase (DNA gyrase/topo II, topoisomerase IV), A subunit
MKISEEDKIFDAHITTKDSDLMFFKSDNTVARTDIENFTVKKGRVTSGVSGTKFNEGAKLVGVISIDRNDEKGIVATVTENGLIKLSYVSEYRQTSRNSKGVKAFKESEKSGNIVKSAYIDTLENDVVIVTRKGIINRISLSDFRVSSRMSTGYKLIDLGKNDQIVSVFIVPQIQEEDDLSEPDALSDEQSIDNE